MARAAGVRDFGALRDLLAVTAQEVHEVFVDRIEDPAHAARAARGDPTGKDRQGGA